MLRKIKVRKTQLKIMNRKMARYCFLTKKRERISLAAAQKINGKKQRLKAGRHMRQLPVTQARLVVT